MPVLPDDLALTVRRALAEDVGSGDLTAQLVPPDSASHATVITREAAVVCGGPWFDRVFRELDESIVIDWQCSEGDSVDPGQVLCTLHGPTAPLLTGERTALNFLQTLSGTATRARQLADSIRGTGATILDTRKTLPGLRSAQKYAVRCGGCENHRMGLYDGVLIKENHILAAGSIGRAVELARAAAGGLPVEVEVEDLAEVDQALAAGADILLLDNFDIEDLRAAVAHINGRARTEASGGVDDRSLPAIAATGVDYVSIGALTKDVTAIDLSMRLQRTDR